MLNDDFNSLTHKIKVCIICYVLFRNEVVNNIIVFSSHIACMFMNMTGELKKYKNIFQIIMFFL